MNLKFNFQEFFNYIIRFDRYLSTYLYKKKLQELVLNGQKISCKLRFIISDLVAESGEQDLEFKYILNLGNDAVYDDRNGRQEDVPTTDINLWQYGLEETWLAVINFYVYPRKCTVFPGHPGLDTGGHFFTVRYRLFLM